MGWVHQFRKELVVVEAQLALGKEQGVETQKTAMQRAIDLFSVVRIQKSTKFTTFRIQSAQKKYLTTWKDLKSIQLKGIFSQDGLSRQVADSISQLAI